MSLRAVQRFALSSFVTTSLISSAHAGGTEASRAFEAGVAADDAGDLATAKKQYLRALELDKDYGRALINLGIVEIREKAYARGVERCKRAIALDARAAKAHYCIGLAESATGKLDAASASFAKAIELHASDPSAKLELAHVRRKQNKHQEAIDLYRAAVRDLPDAPDLHVHLGYCYKALGQWDAAEVEYRKAVQKDPSSFFGHLNLGVVLVHNKKYDEAEPHYRTASELDPDAPKPQFNLGNLMARKGRFDEALKFYRRAIELDPNDAEAHLALARTLWRTGDSDAARAELAKAKALKAPEDVTRAIEALDAQIAKGGAPKPVQVKKGGTAPANQETKPGSKAPGP